jgi:hypothetical protein
MSSSPLLVPPPPPHHSPLPHALPWPTESQHLLHHDRGDPCGGWTHPQPDRAELNQDQFFFAFNTKPATESIDPFAPQLPLPAPNPQFESERTALAPLFTMMAECRRTPSDLNMRRFVEKFLQTVLNHIELDLQAHRAPNFVAPQLKMTLETEAHCQCSHRIRQTQRCYMLDAPVADADSLEQSLALFTRPKQLGVPECPVCRALQPTFNRTLIRNAPNTLPISL